MVPLAEKKKIVQKTIRLLHKAGWSYDEIARLLKVSKTTVLKTLKGRSLKRSP